MSSLIRPFNGLHPVTQTWGVNPQDYARFGLKGHNGIDYGTPVGTVIIAPHDGNILEVASDPGGYGLYVKIENDQEGSILAHLSQQDVRVGEYVRRGDRIGLSGNTGNSTGPHLHWGYYRKPRNKADGYSGTTNPWPYLVENATAPEGAAPVDHAVSAAGDTQKVRAFEAAIRNVPKDIDIGDRNFLADQPERAAARLREQAERIRQLEESIEKRAQELAVKLKNEYKDRVISTVARVA